MPKRVIDYEAMWGSGKLNECKPENRPEYAWLYGLADANGSFELSNLRVIFGKVSAIRPELTMDRLRDILRDFHRNRLLYVWKDDFSGKIFGHWIDSDKPGRLPPRSQRSKYGISAPPVPKAKNQKALPESVTLDLGLDSHPLYVGVNSRPNSSSTSRREGVGFGVGVGLDCIGKENQNTKSRDAQNPRALGPSLVSDLARTKALQPQQEQFKKVKTIMHHALFLIGHGCPDAASLKEDLKTWCVQNSIPYDGDQVQKAIDIAGWKAKSA